MLEGRDRSCKEHCCCSTFHSLYWLDLGRWRLQNVPSGLQLKLNAAGNTPGLPMAVVSRQPWNGIQT